MIYFTADLHFYHDKIIRHASRPFYDVDEMNKTLIRNWNRTVGANDDIYILGDVTMKGAGYATDMLKQLKGRKYLIKGNHDHFVDQADFDNSIFMWIKDYYELTYLNRQFVLFHYPIGEWSHFYHGSIHLHGHQHNHDDYNFQNLENSLHRFDVGVDANNMSPVSIDDILTFFDMVNYK